MRIVVTGCNKGTIDKTCLPAILALKSDETRIFGLLMSCNEHTAFSLHAWLHQKHTLAPAAYQVDCPLGVVQICSTNQPQMQGCSKRQHAAAAAGLT